ncbi:MAG: hypothetical protein FD174_1682 [Geobacteraceae bacterium]|nr:MAG: hypothetical protein FD174_1682 [Geobacteraceae bacterium]
MRLCSRLCAALCLVAALHCLPPRHATAAGAPAQLRSISVIAPRSVLENTISRVTIDDVLRLLRQGFPAAHVALNNPAAQVKIILPDLVKTRSSLNAPFGVRGRLNYPNHDYQWSSFSQNKRTVLQLRTSSPQGASFALYGLLQEKLGYKFHHPKRTLIPRHTRWPLPARFRWEAAPRFVKKGFHLHTLHPMELTEQLHNPAYPGADVDVKEYIDWLVRNQQNTFQFYLLRDIDRARWIMHARQIVDYAHKRGILVGVEFSLSTIQQKAFQAVKLLRIFSSYRRQIDRTLAWLFQAKWDFVTVDFTIGEYLPDMGKLRAGVKDYLIGEVTGRYHTTLMEATHVIRSAQERGDATMRYVAAPFPAAGLPDGAANCGVLIHTVMCYSVTEPKAPVYGNVNQRFMLERAREENLRRETWYWPESSYWVAFDNSVPLFLLPYLDARWNDMQTMGKLGVAGHLTFSSGWEWGYWLIDWSIARWSWEYTDNGMIQITEPSSVLKDLFPERSTLNLWREALRLQNHYLKEKELLKFMAVLDPFSELPPPFNDPFQPRPDFSYAWLLHDASNAEAERVLRGPVADLNDYAEKMGLIVDRLAQEIKNDPTALQSLAWELNRGLEVTVLRAQHRALTLKALVALRKCRQRWEPIPQETEKHLKEATLVRRRALALVREQEQIYRYSVQLIARQRKDFTAYHFGYLYPVSNLFFWEREEEQVRNRRFDAFYRKLWNFRRTIGVESLLF